jgi:hypothetical protein
MNASTINPTNNPFFITASFLFKVSGLQMTSNLDGFVRSPKTLFSVIPAEAGIQSLKGVLDSRLRGSDDPGDFLRTHQP